MVVVLLLLFAVVVLLLFCLFCFQCIKNTRFGYGSCISIRKPLQIHRLGGNFVPLFLLQLKYVVQARTAVVSASEQSHCALVLGLCDSEFVTDTCMTLHVFNSHRSGYNAV